MNAFSFAGFDWPRRVVELPQGTPYARMIDKRQRCRTYNPRVSPYMHAPEPITGKHPGRGFYLGDAGMPGLRWEWADCVTGAGIRHSGWYADDDGIDDTIRGMVFRLPHGRGFLPGWSMGEARPTWVTGDIVDNETDAARWADQTAERVAEAERDYQRRWRAATDIDEGIAEARGEATAFRKEFREVAEAIREQEKLGPISAGICDMLRHRLRGLRADVHRAHARLRDLSARLPEFADVER